jgi:hypothetical protein
MTFLIANTFTASFNWLSGVDQKAVKASVFRPADGSHRQQSECLAHCKATTVTSWTALLSETRQSSLPDLRLMICPTSAISSHISRAEGKNRLRVKTKFACPFNVIWVVQSPREKYFTSVFQNYVIWSRYPASSRGAYRDRQRRGARDAVDATMSCAHEVAGRSNS